MQWQEEGIILSSKFLGERSRVVTVFNRSLGKTSGFFRSSKTLIQSGDICDIAWSGRDASQLGTFRIENIFSPFPFIVDNSVAILALKSVCMLCETGLPEKAPHAKLYDSAKSFLLSIMSNDWLVKYVFFELEFLAEVGVGLNLTECAVTKKTEDLYYVSPKSGKAVTREVGEQYKDKLFVLPKFLIDNTVVPVKEDILDALNMTQYFLKNYFKDISNRELPWAEKSLVRELLKGDKYENQYSN